MRPIRRWGQRGAMLLEMAVVLAVVLIVSCVAYRTGLQIMHEAHTVVDTTTTTVAGLP